MKRKGYIPVAAWIGKASWLYPSTKRVLVAMLSVAGRRMTVRKTLDELAALSHCSRSTVYQAIRQLREYRILEVIRRHHYSPFLNRIVYSANIYRLHGCGLENGYILFPRDVLTQDITHAAFALALHMYRRAGRQGRCYPSVRLLAKTTDFSHATICRTLGQLRGAQIIVRYFCRKINGSLSCNSYYPTAWVRKHPPKEKVFSTVGGLNFRLHLGTRKIARAFTRGKELYGVPEFGRLHNFDHSGRDGKAFESPFFYDGTGIIVRAVDKDEEALFS